MKLNIWKEGNMPIDVEDETKWSREDLECVLWPVIVTIHHNVDPDSEVITGLQWTYREGFIDANWKEYNPCPEWTITAWMQEPEPYDVRPVKTVKHKD